MTHSLKASAGRQNTMACVQSHEVATVLSVHIPPPICVSHLEMSMLNQLLTLVEINESFCNEESHIFSSSLVLVRVMYEYILQRNQSAHSSTKWVLSFE